MMKPTLDQLTQALQSSWGSDTCFDVSKWSLENPARGQCVVSSLTVQDYFGGDLRRYKVSATGLDETHYCNVLPNGTVLDTTGAQYTIPVNLLVSPVSLGGYASIREKRLADDDTRMRYEILRDRVTSILEQNM